MPSKRFSHGLWAAAANFMLILFATSTSAVAEKILYSFQSGTDGAYPSAGLIFDGSGNLYGVTSYGGAYSSGTVFELTPKGGGWTETILHSFGNGEDGSTPDTPLILDGSGNLYGMTQKGGTDTYGTVFELTPKAGGGWTEKVLHNFDGTTGGSPQAGLIFDGSGNLYGTTPIGGVYSYGTVFELTPKAGGGWTQKVLHNFNSKDGANPYAGVIFDGDGNLYGTTSAGGSDTVGTVFELTPKTGGSWTEKVLHSFKLGPNNHGAVPYGGLIFDASGNLYGTTAEGSTDGYGTVFELSPKTGGGWTAKVLHSFTGPNGNLPEATLAFLDGNLYGTTFTGGDLGACTGGCGVVFELIPGTNGHWTERVLHSFTNNVNGVDGAIPVGTPIFDSAGNLYGATTGGGTDTFGTVFQIKP
jgi:uncharacterized repeat protein (TIGR03803 family)